MTERKSGVLLPVFSLPSPYGIGTFGVEARRFVDFLVANKQRYWQILPLNPTGYGDSPYQSFSAFAYNPYFIDLDDLVAQGLLDDSDLDSVRSLPLDHVDYGWIYSTRYTVLRKAFHNFMTKGLNYADAFTSFCREQAFWLDAYARFMVLKDLNGGRSWQEWPAELKDCNSDAVKSQILSHHDQLAYYQFMQFEAFTQYAALKRYANERGIKLIGDAPIYMALDSADVWGHPESFLLNTDKTPVLVAGVPPDYFSATGQLWGNPIYNYPDMEKDGFTFWRNRIRCAKSQCDILRIDHFRGLADYWAIPYGSPDATTGTWVIGPGEKLVDAINAPMKAGADKFGYIFVETSGTVCDISHPTPAGYRNIANKILAALPEDTFPFTDVSASDSYYNAVKYVYENGIMNGTSETTFSPDSSMTRAQLVEALYRLAGSPDVSGMKEPFLDVNSRTASYDAIVWAYNEGIVTGIAFGLLFTPNCTVTRAQLSAMLYRWAGSPQVSGSLSYIDRYVVPSYAKNAVIWASTNGIVAPTSSRTFSPLRAATRAEVASGILQVSAM